MNILETPLPGVLVIEPRVIADERGYFMETYSARRYRDEAGIALPFVQDNVSRSRQGVLRGLHVQRRHPQGKLIQVLEGSVFDVAVDVNPDSPAFGRYAAVALSAADRRQLWIPPGYAHGFCVTSHTATLHYKCTDYYDPADEWGLAWNCPDLAIPWPVDEPILSERDRHHPGLAGLARRLREQDWKNSA